MEILFGKKYQLEANTRPKEVVLMYEFIEQKPRKTKTIKPSKHSVA
jgi:hypothetical protein